MGTPTLGPYKTKAEAVHMVRWMAKGGFTYRVIGKRGGVYFIEYVATNDRYGNTQSRNSLLR